jgi:hypothetical protein
MKVEREKDDAVTITVTGAELRLLRRALERASFIDTPMKEQADIAAFCARALDALPVPPQGPPSAGGR